METRDGFIPLADLQWPITYTWHLHGLYGPAALQMTFDVPFMDGNHGASSALGLMLFERAIAPAISFLAGLTTYDTYCWRTGQSVIPVSRFPIGLRPALPLRPKDGIVVVMHTDHEDRRARRRLIFPSCPRGWVDDNGRMTPEGAGTMMSFLRGLVAGTNRLDLGSEIDWLLWYPEVIPNPLGGLAAPGFRRVHHVRLCEYTVPVPTPTP